MTDVESIFIRWDFVLSKLENELEFIELEVNQGKVIFDIDQNENIKTMTIDEVRIFYSLLIESIKYCELVELFSCLERFLFDDIHARKKDNTKLYHGDACQIKRKTPVSCVIKMWKTIFNSDEYRDIFSYIEDANAYRNWIAHGKRFTCKATSPLNIDETYTSIVLLIDEINSKN